MLVKVNVEDVVDKARDWDAVVADIEVVHEHQMDAGKLSDERPTRQVAEGDGSTRSRHILHEGRVLVAHVLLPVDRARRRCLCPVASGGAGAVDVAGEHLAKVEGDGDGIVDLLKFGGGPSTLGGSCSVGLGPREARGSENIVGVGRCGDSVVVVQRVAVR